MLPSPPSGLSKITSRLSPLRPSIIPPKIVLQALSYDMAVPYSPLTDLLLAHLPNQLSSLQLPHSLPRTQPPYANQGAHNQLYLICQWYFFPLSTLSLSTTCLALFCAIILRIPLLDVYLAWLTYYFYLHTLSISFIDSS